MNITRIQGPYSTSKEDLVIEIARLHRKRRKAAELISDLVFWKKQGIQIVKENIVLRSEHKRLLKENEKLISVMWRLNYSVAQLQGDLTALSRRNDPENRDLFK